MEDWEHQNPKEGAKVDPTYETQKVKQQKFNIFMEDYFQVRINVNGLPSVWPDGYIIFQYWAIHSKGNLPNSLSICPSRFTKFPNTSLSFSKLPKDLQNFAKVAKFRQIWSHCLPVVLLTLSQRLLINHCCSIDTMLNLSRFKPPYVWSVVWRMPR